MSIIYLNYLLYLCPILPDRASSCPHTAPICFYPLYSCMDSGSHSDDTSTGDVLSHHLCFKLDDRSLEIKTTHTWSWSLATVFLLSRALFLFATSSYNVSFGACMVPILDPVLHLGCHSDAKVEIAFLLGLRHMACW
jgi:hypothetical protein